MFILWILNRLADYVLIEPETAKEKTKSGIFLPETAEKKDQNKAVWLLLALAKRFLREIIPLEVKVGDKVLFTKYGPNEIEVNDKKYLITREEDILAVLD